MSTSQNQITTNMPVFIIKDGKSVYHNFVKWKISNFARVRAENCGNHFVVQTDDKNRFYFVYFSGKQWDNSLISEFPSIANTEITGEQQGNNTQLPLKNIICNQDCKLQIFREHPRKSDVSVLWRMALVNDLGQEYFASEIEANFAHKDGQYSKNAFRPSSGGVLILDRDFILDPWNRLLVPNGALHLWCEIKPLYKTKPFIRSIAPSPASEKKALQDFTDLLGKPKYSDTILVSDGHEYRAHRAILTSRVPFFAEHFANLSKTKERIHRIEMVDCPDRIVFWQLLRYVYGGKIYCMEKYAKTLMFYAEKLKMTLLYRECIECLITNLTAKTVIDTLIFADENKIEILKQKCIEFVTQNVTEVTDLDGWGAMLLVSSSRIALLNELYRNLATRTKEMQEKNLGNNSDENDVIWCD